MKNILFFFSFLFVISPLVFSLEEDESLGNQSGLTLFDSIENLRKRGKVIDLSTDNFYEATSTGLWFVEFYAPWCGHCKKFEQEWKEFAFYLSSNPKIFIAKIDADKESKIGEDFRIKSFPTFYLIQDGKRHHFNGKRNTHSLVSFASFISREPFTSLFPEWKLTQTKVVESRDEVTKSSACASPTKKEEKKLERDRLRRERGTLIEIVGERSRDISLEEWDYIILRNHKSNYIPVTYFVQFLSSNCSECESIGDQWKQLSLYNSPYFTLKKNIKKKVKILKQQQQEEEQEEEEEEEEVYSEVSVDWPLSLVHVDCHIDSELCSRYDINLYPTLRLVYQASIYHYTNNQFDYTSLYSFLNSYLSSFLVQWEQSHPLSSNYISQNNNNNQQQQKPQQQQQIEKEIEVESKGNKFKEEL